MKKKIVICMLAVTAVALTGCGKAKNAEEHLTKDTVKAETTNGPTPTLSPMPLDQMEFVAIEDVNIRESGDKEAEVVGGFSKGDRVDVLNDEGDWYQVSYDNGKTGYAAKQFINQIHKLDS